MKITNKLGIGYITCSSPERVAETFKTIPIGIGELAVINSGCILPEETFHGANYIQQTGVPLTVSVSKNRALRHLMSTGCEHIFLIEDDIIIKDVAVFGKYLKAAEASGIWHLNFALQGGLNRFQDANAKVTSLEALDTLKNNSKPAPRGKLEYSNGSKVAFYPHATAPFQYFYRGVIKKVGYFDERYVNCFENIDYIYRVIEMGLHPPYGWFADIDESDKYLESLPDCMMKSVIRNSPDFGENLLFAKQWFKGKFNITPDLISDTGEKVAIKYINALKFKYARNLTDAVNK